MDHELHQLFDPESSTFTYLLVDVATRDAIVVDSVDRMVERDLGVIGRLGLTVRYVVETHAHADHVTGAGLLREKTKGNLDTREQQVLDALLHELRLAFVQTVGGASAAPPPDHLASP